MLVCALEVSMSESVLSVVIVYGTEIDCTLLNVPLTLEELFCQATLYPSVLIAYTAVSVKLFGARLMNKLPYLVKI